MELIKAARVYSTSHAVCWHQVAGAAARQLVAPQRHGGAGPTPIPSLFASQFSIKFPLHPCCAVRRPPHDFRADRARSDANLSADLRYFRRPARLPDPTWALHHCLLSSRQNVAAARCRRCRCCVAAAPGRWRRQKQPKEQHLPPPHTRKWASGSARGCGAAAAAHWKCSPCWRQRRRPASGRGRTHRIPTPLAVSPALACSLQHLAAVSCQTGT